MFTAIVEWLVVYYVGLPIAIFLPLFIFGWLIAPKLLNQPYQMVGEEAKKGRDGFFTKLEPGRVKIVERSGRFIRCVMKYPGHTFAGFVDHTIPVNTAAYWEVIKTPDGLHDAHPVSLPTSSWILWLLFPTYRFTWWVWKRVVYKITGCVFCGIPPFQTIRTYPIEYMIEKTTTSGALVLVRKQNHSDHYRVAQFDQFYRVESADTSGLLPVSVTVAVQASFFNPWLAAYNTDGIGWTTRLFAWVPAKINDYTRQRDLEGVLTGAVSEMEDFIFALGDRDKNDAPTLGMGLQFHKVTVPDRSAASPAVLNQTQLRLADRALAKVDASARGIRAEGDAAAIKTVAAAITEAGAAGVYQAEIDGRVRVAQAAGDRAIISLGGSGQSDPALLAILSELREQKKGNT